MTSDNGVDYQYGLNCIVTSVKNDKEVNLRFVMERKQYTVTYIERKQRFDNRDLGYMLKGSEAVKASIWNVPFGPPGSNKRSWYITDIWTPNIAGMEKKRIPEPTVAIVCKISYNLGKEFVVCDLGKYFSRDVIVIPRTEIRSSAATNVNASANIGDYLLVLALVIWEKQDDDQKARLVPLWAYWDKNFCTQDCTAHLNIIESGQDNSTLLVPEQIPCMWGIVENVYKKSLKVYVSTICSSVSVPLNAVYQYQNTSQIMEGDWLQLWLTPKVTTQTYNHISEVSNWVCSSCCWFGSRAKKRYETYLHLRLASSNERHDVNWAGSSSLENDVGAKPKSTKTAENAKGEKTSVSDIIGVGKVRTVKEKSGILSTSKSDQVFHLGILSIYGIKMNKIKNVNLKDLIDEGSELRYRLNVNTDSLRAVWIGPEVVSYKNLNFMPQLTTWINKRKLETFVVKEMMREVMEVYAVSKSNNKEKDVDLKKASSSEKDESKKKLVDFIDHKPKSKELMQHLCPSLISVLSLDNKGSKEDIPPPAKLYSPDLDTLDPKYFHDDGEELETECKPYSKEEEEELEKLWWSEDSEESEDELRPILKTHVESSGSMKDNTKGSQGNNLGIAPSLSTKEMPCENDMEIKAATNQTLTSKEAISKDKHINPNIVLPSDNPMTDQSSAAYAKQNNMQLETPSYQSQSKSEKNVECKGNESKGKAFKSIPTLVIMTELTKFLLEKGKVKSIPEAGELSAEFVAQLETSSFSAFGITLNATNVATQTVISGPISGKTLNIEE